jgi:N-acetylmuramoyl-L-alanine amidase
VLDLGSSAPVRPVAPPVQRIAGADTVTLISMPAQQAQQQIRKPISLRKVVIIDAGHGGKDPGAQGAAGTEKDVTLAAARALKARLEKSGRYRVVMTRESDAYVPLDTRVQIARHADADLFISLHADSGPDANTRGASVYTLADRASGRSAKFVSKDDWFMKASAPGDRGVSGILFDLTQRATHNRSASFAEMLLDRVADQQPLLRRSHREAGLAVLLAPDVPAVLLEMGFITSPEDEAILGDPAGRARLMGAVADTIDAYFAQETKLASR